MPDELPPLLIFEGEIEFHRKAFETTPLTIISTYLQCFQSDGTQVRGVPQFVLEALAERFLRLMWEETNSLDQAFGGSVARQRNRIREVERNGIVLWEFLRAKEEVEAEDRSNRGRTTPFEDTADRVADRLGMSPDNVRRIYKRTGLKSQF